MTGCQSIVAPPEAEPRTEENRFVPAAVAPTPGDWALFGGADRDLLVRLLRESVEYVDDAVFHEPGAENRLFGGRAPPAGNGAHFVEAPPSRRRTREHLTSAEEVLLFQQFNYARMSCQRVQRQFHGQRMPVEALRLLLAWAHREAELRRRIVEANMALVLGMLGRARLTGLDFNELASEGNLALLRCVNTFNCSLGFKFSTYACRAILKAFARVGTLTSRYRSRFPVTLDPAIVPGDLSEQHHDEAEAMCLEEIRRILAENRAELSVQERRIIRARFMLGSNVSSPRPQTLEQVGRLIGISKERVRQLQNRALQKLRSVLEDSLIRSPVSPGGAQP